MQNYEQNMHDTITTIDWQQIGLSCNLCTVRTQRRHGMSRGKMSNKFNSTHNLEKQPKSNAKCRRES